MRTATICQIPLLAAGLFVGCAAVPQPTSEVKTAPQAYRGMAQILLESKPEEWQPIAREALLVMRIAGVEEPVVIRLADDFAPLHTANIRTLVRQKYFDGLSILRSQDNFVVQWGDSAEDAAKKRSLGEAKSALPAEFFRSWLADLDFTPLPDPDGFAPEVGFSQGFAVGRDVSKQTIWPAHCYGVVGAGRDNDESSGPGTELYAVTGHAPRQLDQNIAVVGRVVLGIEGLSAMPRGTAAMGFYDKPEQRMPLVSVRLMNELPIEEQFELEALNTASQSFSDLVEARRNRGDEWYKRKAGYIDLCNVPLPVRIKVKS